MSPPSDPFGTEAVRSAVLEAWVASPSRFREDANAEEDLVRGGYRDRWLVELAQNAADAAARADRPTRLRIRLVRTAGHAEVRVAGAGEPLTAAGVAALASLRASAQRDHQGPGGSVGRFGVGFAAVTAISDAPRVASTSGSVVFDRTRSRDVVATVSDRSPALAEELARRRGEVPVLRLVWPSDEAPDLEGLTDGGLPDGGLPDGGPVAGTEVRLPLRPDVDPADLVAEVHARAHDLLLALPWLHGVDLDGIDVSGPGVEASWTRAGEDAHVTVTGPDGEHRWRVARAGGELAVLGDLAVEDRERHRWEVVWAAPEGARHRDVLHAPTPTDERLTLPARLLATVPLDPDRRHVRPGPTTEHVLAAAGAHYPDLVRASPPGTRVALVPTPGLPASAVDATVRAAVLEALRTSAWLPGPEGADLVPARATVLDPELDVPGLAEALDGAVAGLATTPPAGALPALATLGVTRLGAAGLTEALAGVRRPPAWWRALYAALAPAAASARVRDELASLPVPLTDGRTVLGARGSLLLEPESSGDAVTAALADTDVPGLRVVHPDAAHPLLVTLGATRADPAALLEAPALREAVERSVDDAEAGLDVDPLARLVLALLDGGTDDGSLGALALPDADGEYRRADELLLPGGTLHALVDADGPFGVLAADVVAAHPGSALTAVGVLDGFAILRDDQPAGPDHDLDDEEIWWSEEVDPFERTVSDVPADPGPLVAVRDLELVADDRWPAAWTALAGERAVREAVGLAGPRTAGDAVRPYTSWWLARHARLAGRAPTAWRLPGDAGTADLVGLYDPVPDGVGLDVEFLAAVGVRARLEVRTPSDARDLLDRLADPARTVEPAAVAAAHAALVGAVTRGRIALDDVDPPAHVRTADGSVVEADPDPDRGAPPVVLDHPWLLGVLTAGAVVPPGPGDPHTLADLLDLAVASARLRGLIRSTGTPTSWRRLPEVVAWASSRGVAVPAGEVVLHERLHVLVVDDEFPGRPVEHTPRVWREPDGTLHTDDPVRALGAVARVPAGPDPGAYSDA